MKTIGILIGIFLLHYCSAQNLVPNPSFESYSSCPIANGSIGLAIPWTDPSTGSSDYYNTCSINIQSTVPLNSNGYRPPRHGNAYAGVVTYVTTISNAREYIEVELTSMLIKDSTYCIGFYVSLSQSSQYGSNGLSAFISNSPITCLGCLFPFIPQVNYLGSPIVDTLGWTLISGE